MVMFHSRGYRGSRRRSIPKVAVNSFKKVLNFKSASFTAGFTNEQFLIGVDGSAQTQTTNVDGNITTGSIFKYAEIQFCISNVVSTAVYINCTIQYRLSGQSFIDPDLVGGNPQRNQILHQELFVVGANQNSTHKFKFKVPKRFQRVREGMAWSVVWRTNATVNRETQIIYKVYR